MNALLAVCFVYKSEQSKDISRRTLWRLKRLINLKLTQCSVCRKLYILEHAYLNVYGRLSGIFEQITTTPHLNLDYQTHCWVFTVLSNHAVYNHTGRFRQWLIWWTSSKLTYFFDLTDINNDIKWYCLNVLNDPVDS